MQTGRPAAVVQRAHGAGRPPPTREHPASRGACGLDQLLDHPAIAGGLADQQVPGDALVRARLLGEQSGGTAVALCALCSGELRIDPAADDRMDERQRPARLEDPRSRQQVGCFGRLGLIEACESRRLEKIALLEDRQRPSEPPRMLRQPTEPEANRAADRSCPNPLHLARGLRGWSDTSFAERVHEHAQQERRPAGCAQTGVDEDRIRNPSEPRVDKLGDGRARQRKRDGSHRRRDRSSPSSSSSSIGALLPRAGRHDERGVQLFEAREQEGQVTQGRGVGPVRVVDDHAKRTRSGQVRAQPVEAVEDRERGIDARGGRAVGRAVRPEARAGRPPRRQRLRGDRRARPPMPRPAAARTADAPLRRRNRAPARSPRAKHAHPTVCRRGPRRGEQRRLAHPSRPFDHHERAAPRASLGQRRLDPRQLLAPFEELSGGRGLASSA